MLHEATMCLLTAYATHRTLVLTTNGWRFTPSTWDTFMMPLSTCTANDTRDMDPKNQTASARVVQLQSLIGEWNHSPSNFRPRAIPADLARRLKTFHGDPPTWWVGQLVSFLLRPQPHLQPTIQTQGEKMGFQRPIVGLQVRRSDKVNVEAALHSLEEYMKHVEEYYDLRQQHEDIKERRLFLATDDPSVFTELNKKYPQYNISRVEGSATAASVNSRYNKDGLSAVLVDLYFLSMCDFVVCTFTSNICRAVYELLQTRHGDASMKVYSLDSSVYYLTYYDIHYLRAVYNHEARFVGELSIQVGDLIHVENYLFGNRDRSLSGNLRNGSTFGINKRTGKRGLFPSYKAVEEIVEENMGEYD
ncbi:alpha-(1,6)-fucosyltransferase-like [Pomacea canaliculata]|uniref:alpha-(1,6)-fucosyltransferase-like n=1 Tax=Pomacea canaliculata TaxID=400727 RepID=UPI000D73B532|nr:alpha-(1,6)-fucosyltransferase-like [Pomacea canaliculata]